MNLWQWLKNHKLTTLLLLAVVFLLFKDRLILPQPISSPVYDSASVGGVGGLDKTQALRGEMASLPNSGAAPQPEIKNRLVVEESNVSAVVDDVRQKVDKVLAEVTKQGGYMVSSTLTQPEEAPFASLVVRLPNKELRPMLAFLRGLAIKVTSENLRGTDVTDQYVDLEARLDNLNKTKAKYEDILAKAVTVQDILQVQQQLSYLQEQIDSLKGQQKYLEKTAENSKLTIYLSSDEFSLPYAPEPSFRPNVIFKEAVRSLVTTLRSLGKAAIWLLVYSVVWLPILLLILVIKKKRRK
jgi:hypothetical protein